MQLDLAPLPAQRFHRGLVADQGNDDLAGARRRLLAHDDDVAIQDSGVHHAVAAHEQAEQLVLVRAAFDGDVPLDVFDGRRQRAGLNPAQDGNLRQRPRPQRTRREAIAARARSLGEPSLLDQPLQMLTRGLHGPKAEAVPHLPGCRRLPRQKSLS